MKSLRFITSIGKDGVLEIRVPLATEMEGEKVLVTVEPVVQPKKDDSAEGAEWRQILEETYGSCAGLGLERPPQSELEERDVIE
jgi:hypothetical protein